MPTAKPRIMVTLDKHQHQVLASICASTGQSMSSILREFVDQGMPVLERMAVTFQKLRSIRDAEHQRLSESLEAAQAAIEPIAQEAVGQFDLFLAKVDRAAGRAGLPRSGSPASGSPMTPPTNRGVTPHLRKGPKAKAGATSRAVRKSRVFSKKGGKTS
jgi:predicted DNA-binding protein